MNKISKKISEFNFDKEDLPKINDGKLYNNELQVNLLNKVNNLVSFKLTDDYEIKFNGSKNCDKYNFMSVTKLANTNILFKIYNDSIKYNIGDDLTNNYDLIYNIDKINNLFLETKKKFKFTICGLNITGNSIWFFIQTIESKKHKYLNFVSCGITFLNNNIVLDNVFKLRGVIDIYRKAELLNFSKEDVKHVKIESIDIDATNNIYILFVIRKNGFIGKVNFFMDWNIMDLELKF